jgi:hypothetical protein
MKVDPSLKSDRFAQLKPGDLFIHPLRGNPSFAMKVVDPSMDGDTYVLPLGPTFPNDPRQPRLYDERGVTTASFGKDFIFQLSVRPSAWSVELPDEKYFCAALAGEAAYLRVNYDQHHANRYLVRWVKLADGVLHENIGSVAAFTTAWSFSLPRGALPPLLLFEYTGTALPSD